MTTTLIQYELVNLDEEREHEYEALPCPFCQSERVEFIQGGYSDAFRCQVMCVDCNARGPAKREYQGAVDRWNSLDRCFTVTPDAVHALQARLTLAQDVIAAFVIPNMVKTPEQRTAWAAWTGTPVDPLTPCACPVPGFWVAHPETCPTCNRPQREKRARKA